MKPGQMEAYYRARASEYDVFYRIPEHKSDLARLARWVVEHTRGRTVLEVAAGTGYWTGIAARVARRVVATDFNANTLAIAAKRCLGGPVDFRAADAYRLPSLPLQFEVAMAHLWWSHVERQRRKELLLHLSSKLEPKGTLLMIDQNFVPGFSAEESRRDKSGNRYEIRTVGTGSRFEIIKNYPSAGDLRNSLEAVCCHIQVIRLRYFWAVRGTISRDPS
jgi:SAM-dependent methyltransferase